MKLLIKGKILKTLDKLTVYGEDGKVRYYLKREKDAPGQMVALNDVDGNKLADIARQGIGFAVIIDGEQVAVVQKKPGIQPNYFVYGPDWDVSGSVFSTKYKVTKGDRSIANLKVSMLRSEIEINDEENPFFAVAVVMAIRLLLYYASLIGAAATTATIGPV